MTWWMWIIAVILVLIGGYFLVAAFTEGDPNYFMGAVFFIAAAVLGIIYFKHWRPQDQRAQAKAVVDIRHQQIRYEELNEGTNSGIAWAGKCLIPLELNKVKGVYRLEIKKLIELPQGASVTVDVPVDADFLAAIGKLPLCQ